MDKVEIIIPNGDLKREVWSFYLRVDFARISLWLDEYYLETKETKRHKWKWQSRWIRTMSRDSNIEQPVAPEYVITEAKDKYKTMIDNLQIEY